MMDHHVGLAMMEAKVYDFDDDSDSDVHDDANGEDACEDANGWSGTLTESQTFRVGHFAS